MEEQLAGREFSSKTLPNDRGGKRIQSHAHEGAVWIGDRLNPQMSV